jgi:hypothetical protein
MQDDRNPRFEIRLFDISQPGLILPVKSKEDLIDILFAPLRPEIIADSYSGAAYACGAQSYPRLLEHLIANSAASRDVLFRLDYWYFFCDSKRAVRTFVLSELTKSWSLTQELKKMPNEYDAIDFWKTEAARLP